MMIEEFRKLQNPKATPIGIEDYKLVEFVYAHYPYSLSKETCALLWDQFGLILFLDMLPRAKKYARLEIDIRITKQKLEDMQEQYREASQCIDEEWTLEI